jgi:hypothetical protein
LRSDDLLVDRLFQAVEMSLRHAKPHLISLLLTLHVGHESDSQGERIEREVPLNDFMREGAGTPAELQNLIDRMFNGA